MSAANSSHRIRYPDARLSGLREFFDILRNEPGWKPDPITTDTFRALRIARGKERNAIFALEFLGIINGQGAPTEEFDHLRGEYQPTLERLVRSSYAKLFETIPIGRMNQQTLVGFFMTQGYSEETAEYQGKLFVDLCRDAEIQLPKVEPTFKRARFRKKHKLSLEPEEA